MESMNNKRYIPLYAIPILILIELIFLFRTLAVSGPSSFLTTSFLDENQLLNSTYLCNLPRSEYTIYSLDDDFLRLYTTPNDDEVVKIVSKTGKDIRDLSMWIGKNIRYRYDKEVWGESEYFQLPRETIRIGTGDCEDMAFLLASLARAAGHRDVYVALGTIEGTGHAWVIYRKNTWHILEPTGEHENIYWVDLIETGSYAAGVASLLTGHPLIALACVFLGESSKDLVYTIDDIMNKLPARGVSALVNDNEIRNITK